MDKLHKEFYRRDTIQVAKDLLGKYIVVNKNDKKIIAKIVEVEAYLGINDKAAHSYGGRRTERTKVMYEDGGCIYVFQIYGMYNCLNIVTSYKEVPQAVLIRAVEPISNIDEFSFNRFKKNFNELTKYQQKNITNGPGKLCMAMNITKEFNGKDLSLDTIYILDNKEEFQVVSSKRIGIDYAEEAKDYLLRFYIKNNKYVSKK
ncbi:3-methyladenine DNA glycosylase [Clostridium novyi B str. ATCC 27606]|uniref:Putative 3-methyladenine DNA glycosylase n=2 Tax=Clostridium TaxID=1485 RepID=A0AA40M334_CLONO|nr:MULTISPECIES: DNA-3-methyladenine glycosylase [Clostridium]KEI12528.1 3-methyladenine DNA glycosylase [Clostridium novyi B str. NCTC 9691]KEI16385.1 3-methyladenine DNA glycosylase [Clostridium novyi B str. ATCC 27606]KEI18551.1 3-methyladenine DNA glycosylase [Clostridium haemolyticum NCTC 9693]KGN04573.1 3-methyladenine DNA glycosylase [Clostridium haemolyticum NCTC 8350]CAG7840145.1 Putative 3-methyladenine DNA glycosylase [Clostridium haemolyticum]